MPIRGHEFVALPQALKRIQMVISICRVWPNGVETIS